MKQNLDILLVPIVTLLSGILINNACSGNNRTKNEAVKTDTITLVESISIDTTKNEEKKISFRDYLSGERYKYVRWAPNTYDTVDYQLECEIDLSKGNVVQYWYHEQCLYEYFIYPTSDTTIDVE